MKNQNKKTYTDQEKIFYYEQKLLFCWTRIQQLKEKTAKAEFKTLAREIIEEYKKLPKRK